MIRSLLFIPGNSPAMLQNADVYGADALILDLEDAVAPSEKDAARALVRRAVASLHFACRALVVRINPVDSPFFEEDLRAMVPLAPDFLMPAKVRHTGDVLRISNAMAEQERLCGIEKGSVGLLPLIETAEGVENAYTIAGACPRVQGLLLGAEDLSSDLEAVRSVQGEEIAYARGRLVMAARAQRIDAYDTPFTAVNDLSGLQKDAAFARSLGFSGKAVISPRHIAAVNEAFSPTAAEIQYAQQVMLALEEGERLGKGAVSLFGKMVDKPIADRARRVLQQAEALGMRGQDDE